MIFFFFQTEDGIRDGHVTGVQTCALPIFTGCSQAYTGPSTTQEREIETVSVVELDTSGELNVVTGDHAALTVTAGENVIDRLTSEVERSEERRVGEEERSGGRG